MRYGVVVIALVAAPLFADDVYLKGGGQITGQIVAQTDESVTVDVGGGTMTVRRSSVVRIEQNTSPLQEYREKASRIAEGDAEGWRELARWATAGAMGTMASQAWSKVVEVLPDDPEANRALGRVQYGGRWVTEEERFRAEGYVQFEGEWMKPGERQAILQDRRAQEDAARREQEAQMQANAQAKAERDAQWEAEHEFWHDTPQNNGLTYWPWGYAPAIWPSTPAQGAAPVRPATLPARGR